MIPIYRYGQVADEDIFARAVPAVNVESIVAQIIDDVKAHGDEALLRYCQKFDRATLPSLQVTPEELEDFLRHGQFTGLNVTIPYKKDVVAYCDELSPRAALLGAVNTIVRRADGSLIGHNTDYFGFQSMLKRTGLKVAGNKVLVLGSGGASATAVCVLRELKANVIVISRSGENNYENISAHKDAAVIVNAACLTVERVGGLLTHGAVDHTRLAEATAADATAVDLSIMRSWTASI